VLSSVWLVLVIVWVCLGWILFGLELKWLLDGRSCVGIVMFICVVFCMLVLI